MAGDWIAIRSALITSPKLVRMARVLDGPDFNSWAIAERDNTVVTLTNAARKCVTLALLTAAWSYAREHGKDDDDDLIVEHMDCEDLDEIVGGAPHFAQAMIEVGWLEPFENGLKFPNFREFNPRTGADRQREYRKRQRDNEVTTGGDVKVTPTEQNSTVHNRTGASDEAPGTPPPDCPHEAIINLYHETCPSLRRVGEWTPERQKLLRTRWREKPERQSLDWWRQYFERVATSDFLCGRIDDSEFTADLEWLIRPKNMPKVLEGKYDGARKAKPGYVDNSGAAAEAKRRFHERQRNAGR